MVMRIGELARQAGVNIQTIRFYERKGLLPVPRRKPSGYRLYAGEDLHRLRFILRAKELGFSLEEIRQILGMRAQRACPCGHVVSLGERHLRDIRQTIRRLTGFEKELARAIRKWKSAGQPELAVNEFCKLIEGTIRTTKE